VVEFSFQGIGSPPERPSSIGVCHLSARTLPITTQTPTEVSPPTKFIIEVFGHLETGMEPYKNLSGDSGVQAYELSAAGIVVQFKDGWKYEYTERSAGAAAVAAMRRLAVAGRGLSGFISTNVREAYARKFR
jgi:hypothetical protein